MVKTFYIFIYLLIAVSTCSYTECHCQLIDSTYRNPVDIPMKLSGNFGEFRSNHFHTGIDIKTNGRVGYPVYAITDGWVRRIKTGPFSYGKVLYLDHPNGVTSVYAHLSRYNDTISDFLSLSQSLLQRNEVDIFPNKNRIPIKKGDLVGYTGNSGRSGGPHLHFELRDTETEKPINPLRYGFSVIDKSPPVINGLLVEHIASDTSRVIKTDRYYSKKVNGANKITETVLTSDLSGLSVHTLDYLTGSSNPCGVYGIELFIDGALQYKMTLDSLDFSTSRYINAHKNYKVFKSEKSSFHRCFRIANNPLQIYELNKDGIIRFNDDLKHDVEIKVEDAAGNFSSLTFKAARKKGSHSLTSSEELLDYSLPNSLFTDGCSLRIPPDRLIENASLRINKLKKKGQFSGFYELGSNDIPLQNLCLLSIRLDSSFIEVDDLSKFFIQRYNPSNGRTYAQGGEFKDGWINTRIKQFGTYTIGKDTTPPSVKINISGWSKTSKVRIKVTDDLSGIDNYSLHVNGKWVPLYYNYKTANLEGVLNDDFIITGVNKAMISVTDERKNETIVEGEFNR